MYTLIVHFEVRLEFIEQFDEQVSLIISEIKTREPGTLVYISNSTDSDPLIRVFLEVYRDKRAWETHTKLPHIKRFLETITPMACSVNVHYLDSISSSVLGA